MGVLPEMSRDDLVDGVDGIRRNPDCRLWLSRALHIALFFSGALRGKPYSPRQSSDAHWFSSIIFQSLAVRIRSYRLNVLGLLTSSTLESPYSFSCTHDPLTIRNPHDSLAIVCSYITSMTVRKRPHILSYTHTGFGPCLAEVSVRMLDNLGRLPASLRACRSGLPLILGQ